ncbi:FinO bacterial conjugation repressor C-terminal domain protein (plasmid) [Candidatus Trichorickettsia mobilis]|uniref:FinO bacterial conjugation repressor C-terminal domain protein n=1 Tax=Candidatus Trichorickettsia mobilis TaxID=1346319 RepID=A0ABZ0UVE6_9RICK|nr:ProQ/FINO family protein [Candidatus Trichorickettsia mobilis]WPY01481.1 FinO bacterial conjugation repressor C-terminal domain protein [Candidatus Trichorickettsia mobilis]
MLTSKELTALAKKIKEKYPIIDTKNLTLLDVDLAKELQEKCNLIVDEAKQFAKWYQGIRYKKLIVEGATKYNLDGEIVGVVSAEEALKMQEYVEKIIAEKKEKSEKAKAVIEG